MELLTHAPEIASTSMMSGSAAVTDLARFPFPGGVPGPGPQLPDDAPESVAEQLRVDHGAFENREAVAFEGNWTKTPGEERRMSRSPSTPNR